MANEIFVDTSGFLALMASRDRHHETAAKLLSARRRAAAGFVTTDYVLDETATLLSARGQGHLLQDFFSRVLESHACRVTWTDSARFRQVAVLQVKHRDQGWSFTDCLSFHVMREFRLRKALTSDVHFEQAGFERLLK